MTRNCISALLAAASLAATCAAGEPLASDQPRFRQFVKSHCLDCHEEGKKGGLALDDLLAADPAGNAEAWEKVVRKLTARQMPPKEAPRPKEGDYDAAVAWLESSLDAAAAKSPNPG